MGIGSTRPWLVVLFMVMMMVIFDDIREVRAQTEYCLDEVIGLSECEQYFTKRGPQLPPSEPCCDAVRAATNNIACVCQYVTPKAIDVISVTKVAFVARSCGRPLPHGMTCGSMTIPRD